MCHIFSECNLQKKIQSNHKFTKLISTAATRIILCELISDKAFLLKGQNCEAQMVEGAPGGWVRRSSQSGGLGSGQPVSRGLPGRLLPVASLNQF